MVEFIGSHVLQHWCGRYKMMSFETSWMYNIKNIIPHIPSEIFI
ncbi:hypothetical protein BOVA208_4010 [Bacteroides ovatus]|nr:hypothetical protein BOVA208_4010 [Bacteroides ovatus]